MKYLLIILIPILYGCQTTTELSLQVQAQANDAQKKIVKETVQKITTLKEEVTTLKIELNEVKAALDSVSSDTGSIFILLPIPKDKKDR